MNPQSMFRPITHIAQRSLQLVSTFAIGGVAILGAIQPSFAQVVVDDVPAGGLTFGSGTNQCNSFFTRTFSVDSDVPVGDITLGLNISHSNRGQIAGFLQASNGAFIRLDPGTADTNDNYDVLFQDGGGALNDGAADNVGTPFFERSVAPTQSLSTFAGLSPRGDWTLFLCDRGSGVNGTYNRSRLTILPPDISGVAFDDVNRDNIPAPTENRLADISVTAYRDDGDGVFEPGTGDLLISTVETSVNGTYAFSGLSNADYWIDVDENDSDLAGRSYGGSAASGTEDPRLVTFSGAPIADENLPFFQDLTSLCIPGEPQGDLTFLQGAILESGTDLQIGAIYRFPGVFPNVDALVEVSAFNGGASLASIDNDTSGVAAAFQPTLNALPNTTSSVDFNITFVHRNTSTSVPFIYRAAGVDIDGDSDSLREFIELTNLSSFILSADTTLTASSIVNGNRFESNTVNTQPGVSATALSTLVNAEFNAVAQLRYRIGAIDSQPGASQQRLNSLFLGCTSGPSIDYGDAPDTYGTDSIANNSGGDSVGPSHTITNGLQLGTALDSDNNGQPTVGADGDGNDEDGIDLPTLTETATSYTIPVSDIRATGTGTLHAWVDFNNNDTFEPGEYQSVAINNGTPNNALTWNSISVDTTADRTTYTRFRLTTDTNINANTPGGGAIDGEVEDYQVAIASPPTSPMGPACVSTTTSLFNTTPYTLGARVEGLAPLTFYSGGLSFDAELNGIARFNDGVQVRRDDSSSQPADPSLGNHIFVQPNRTANYLTSGNNATYTFSYPTSVTNFTLEAGGLNNQDGTTIIATHRGVPVQITSANFSNLSAGMRFVDADNDGESDTVVSDNTTGGVDVTSNTYTLNIAGPVDQVTIVTGKEDASTGNVTLGFLALGYCAEPDYGDAPLSFDNTAGGGNLDASDDPASHAISSTLFLGSTLPDAETAPQSSPAADGDDSASGTAVDDEDGIATFPALNESATSYSVTTTVNNTNNRPANVYAWIDFDRDGEFDEDERAGQATVAANSTNVSVPLSWSNIGSSGSDIASGDSYVRVRVTTDNLDTTTETAERDDASVGTAIDGEVEDYPLEIAAAVSSDPNVLLVKRITRVNQQNTNGSLDLDVYVNDPAYPYDDNELESPAPTPVDTENWPNTTAGTNSTFLRGVIEGGETRPGDEIEYTIYFLSAGEQDAEDVQFCDRIPNSQSFVPDAFNATAPAPGGGIGANRGILVEYDGDTFAYSNDNDGDTARFFRPGEALPGVCSNVPNQSEDNGAVVVNLGTLPNSVSSGTPAGSYGLFRFRAIVK